MAPNMTVEPSSDPTVNSQHHASSKTAGSGINTQCAEPQTTHSPPQAPTEEATSNGNHVGSLNDLALTVSDNENDEDGLLGSDPNDPSHLRAMQEDEYELLSPSLARSSPCIATIFIPLLAVFTHGLFLYGQLAPMWLLHVQQDVDVWANATSKTSRYAFDTLGLDHEHHLYMDRNDTVREFTYGFAIKELWEANKISSKVMPRLAAVLLVFFSGVWPHLKLLLLNYTWLAKCRNTQKRSTTLSWLATLGKWSLADVLAVCVMVGVLNLDWDINPAAIKDGVMAHLPTLLNVVKSLWRETAICGYFLKYDCAHPHGISQKTKCSACRTAIHEAFNHPGWVKKTGNSIVKDIHTSGGGTVKLAVVGMKGIYAFCGAVILSVLLSLVVDVFDYRAKQKSEKEQLVLEKGTATPASLTEDEASEPLLWNSSDHGGGSIMNNNNGDNIVPMELDDGMESVMQKAANMVVNESGIFQRVAPWITLAMVVAAVALPCMERVVDGAIPLLLHDILGITWERAYSLYSLEQTTGAAGGWDLLLMGTFGLFVVFGPVIRAFLVLLLKLCPGKPKWQHSITTMISFVGAFCAWEVFVSAMVMVEMLMPSITNTIVHNDACAQVATDGSCLQVEFNTLPSFGFVLVGGVLLLLMSSRAIRQDQEANKASNELEDGSHYVVLRDDEARMEDVIKG